MVCIPPSGGPLRQRQDNKKSASVVAARFRLVSLADWDWELGIGIGIGIATHVGALCADHAQRSAHVSSPRWVWTHRRSIGGEMGDHRHEPRTANPRKEQQLFTDPQNTNTKANAIATAMLCMFLYVITYPHALTHAHQTALFQRSLPTIGA